MQNRRVKYRFSSLILRIIMTVIVILAMLSLVIDLGGFDISKDFREKLGILDLIVVSALIIEYYVGWGLERFRFAYLKRNWLDFALIFIFLGLFLAVFRYNSSIKYSRAIDYTVVARWYIIGSLLIKLVSAWQRIAKADLSPAVIVVLSFLFVILLGTGFLLFPGATIPSEDISVIDALFTATSATCVTGLIVVDTGSYFSRFGHLVILFLIQIGGLGLITITAFFSLVLSGSMSIKESVFMSNVLSSKTMSRLSKLIISTLAITIGFELLGVILLYISWLKVESFKFGSVIYYSIFHSISAFCNAGFSLFNDSFEGFAGNMLLNFTVTSLIIIGGLGFVVLTNLINIGIFRRGRLSLHTRLVLIITAVLIITGTLLILTVEWNKGLGSYSFPGKLLISYFQSVTTRTAGFNTVTIGNLTYACQFLMMIFMFIGASPGGTGGGIKTTTFGIFLGSVWGMLKGRSSVEMFKRNIPKDIVNNALLLTILALVLISLFGSVLLMTQKGDPVHILFELFSAFGTVGLSAGVTPSLTTLGKAIIIITMFVGRVGPLTLAFAVSQVRQRHKDVIYEYPRESLILG